MNENNNTYNSLYKDRDKYVDRQETKQNLRIYPSEDIETPNEYNTSNILIGMSERERMKKEKGKNTIDIEDIEDLETPGDER